MWAFLGSTLDTHLITLGWDDMESLVFQLSCSSTSADGCKYILVKLTEYDTSEHMGQSSNWENPKQMVSFGFP